jgi:hypothetical protein
MDENQPNWTDEVHKAEEQREAEERRMAEERARSQEREGAGQRITSSVGMMMSALMDAPMAATKNLQYWMLQSQANAEALGQAFQGTMNYALSCQQSLMEFMSMRLQKNAELGRDLADCRDQEGLIHLLARANRTALEDYVKETKKLADKSLQMLPESIMNPLEKRAKATMQEMPKAKIAA